MNAQRPIYERGPHKDLANLQQQNIVNENIIEVRGLSTELG